MNFLKVALAGAALKLGDMFAVFMVKLFVKLFVGFWYVLALYVVVRLLNA